MCPDIPIFGSPLSGLAYKDRPGAYALIQNERSEIAVVKTAVGYYLPGGGIEEGETAEGALARECWEECGFGIRVQRKCGSAVQYIVAPEGPFRIIGDFFAVTVEGAHSAQTRGEHELLWLWPENAALNMQRPFEAWAIRNFAASAFD